MMALDLRAGSLRGRVTKSLRWHPCSGLPDQICAATEHVRGAVGSDVAVIGHGQADAVAHLHGAIEFERQTVAANEAPSTVKLAPARRQSSQ